MIAKEVDLTAVLEAENNIDNSQFNNFLREQQSQFNALDEQRKQKLKTQRVLFYASIVVVIGIVVFIIIKKHKK